MLFRSLNHRLRKRGYLLIGLPDCPVIHCENETTSSFSKQMWGYAWSRARLWRVTGTFTYQHALPTLACLVWAVLTFPWGTIPLSLLPIYRTLIPSLLDKYYKYLPERLVWFLCAGVMFSSWVMGYVDGVLNDKS